MNKNTHATIAANVQALMSETGVRTQKELAKKTGLAQRTISNVLNPGSVGSIRIETLDSLARFFNIESYHLMIPDLPIEELKHKRIEKVIECYAQSSPEGRENIKRIAENEVRYYSKKINSNA